MTTRLSVNVTDETAQTLRDLAKRNETSVTDIVRRAVSVYKLVDEETREGKVMQLVADDEVITLALV